MKSFSRFKLRLLFSVFFLALVIPSAILSWQAYEQLRWQAFRQYQKQAQSLVQLIDHSFASVINKEESRPAEDYDFLLPSELNSSVVQRSSLSQVPVPSDLAGLIGYFQVDETGHFSSPVLPASPKELSMAGLKQDDYRTRARLASSILEILSENKLLERNLPAADSSLAAGGVKGDVYLELDQDQELKETPSELLAKPSRQTFKDRKPAVKAKSQAQGFSQLKSIEQQALIADNVGRELSDKTQQHALEKRSQKNRLAEAKQLSLRTKKLEASYQAKAKKSSPQTMMEQENNSQLTLFKSELAPIQFSLLESGHFVIYRQVWRKQKRFIQGAVLSGELFLDDSIKPLFLQSSLLQVSNLSIAYANRILKTYQGHEQRYISSSKAMQGEVLTVLSLNAPFSQLSLMFHVTKMPIGAGANFIIMVALSLLLILVLGTYFLYRLILRQSHLAQQQQDFVSSVSHELKTPLTSIRMYGEILKQGWASEDKKREYYDFIFNEAERLTRLINNVLQISKVSRNALSLDLCAVTVAELASLVESKIDSQIKQSGFKLDLRLDAGLKHRSLNVDRDAFIQIIINLVDNAIKYSKPALQASPAQVDIIFRGSGYSLELAVRDYGPGIAKEQIKHIFKLFYRSGNELTREVTGTGIGLALVKELAQAMQAKVSVKNRDQGTEFIVLFPLVP